MFLMSEVPLYEGVPLDLDACRRPLQARNLRKLNSSTGVPRAQETAPPYDPTIGLCLGPYGGSRVGALSHERGTPVPPS